MDSTCIVLQLCVYVRTYVCTYVRTYVCMHACIQYWGYSTSVYDVLYIKKCCR